jgi:uncharacterized membrane protein
MKSVPAPSKKCELCGRRFPHSELTPLGVVRAKVMNEVRKDAPEVDINGYICREDLNRVRNAYIQSLIEEEKGEVSSLENEVIQSLIEHETLSVNSAQVFQSDLTLGQRWADRIAEFGGSWKFIGIFLMVMVVWMAANTVLALSRPFDPYPFILLNLVLSCLAAIQAPVIMMSQNRQEARDRLQAENDYRVNLKAELEIRHLHEKVDHLLRQQWERLVEIQRIQIELMDEMTKGRPRD